MSAPRFLIWSNQHNAWWRAHESGYTGFIEEAGRYPETIAVGIVAQATLMGALVHKRTDPITGEDYPSVDEVMVLAPESFRESWRAMRWAVETVRRLGGVFVDLDDCAREAGVLLGGGS